MIRRLVRHGDDFALILDREQLVLLGIQEDTPLRVRVEGGALLVSPEPDPGRRARFEEALEECYLRYGNALRRLAEGPDAPRAP
ncbi:MAG: AbrB/MazE/SpoVT family DNA-binding domain-containing protein [Planctomycetes bacterium]|nr:AbrB/MazE/SpoVT family DNA-binding domain-containing protein [Planctomycetota bacterium]